MKYPDSKIPYSNDTSESEVEFLIVNSRAGHSSSRIPHTFDQDQLIGRSTAIKLAASVGYWKPKRPPARSLAAYCRISVSDRVAFSRRTGAVRVRAQSLKIVTLNSIALRHPECQGR